MTVIGIVGLGTMGLALAQLFGSQGSEVRGFDSRKDVGAPEERAWAHRGNFTIASLNERPRSPGQSGGWIAPGPHTRRV